MQLRPGSAALAAAFYLVLAAWATWPLPTMFGKLWWWPRSLMRTDQRLHMWTMRWALHALATDPWRLFDGNAFHPAPRSLAGADHLLGALPVFAPAWALSRNPIVGLNTVSFTSFVLGGLFVSEARRTPARPA